LQVGELQSIVHAYESKKLLVHTCCLLLP